MIKSFVFWAIGVLRSRIKLNGQQSVQWDEAVAILKLLLRV